MRRYDLDWLRVLVFALLIFYHIGMLFVPWDYHIKNNILYDWMQFPMWFLNQWRLPILFIISGMGSFYALKKRTGKQFLLERLYRLGLPLIFGMAIIIPPQVYIERLYHQQFSGSFLNFLSSEAFLGIYPEGNISWNHLWFIAYLLLFSIAFIPLFIWIRNWPNNALSHFTKQLCKSAMGLYVFIIPLYFAEAFLEPRFPVTHALIGDWFTIINSSLLFVFGFLLAHSGSGFWTLVEKFKSRYLTCAIICFTSMLLITIKFEDSYARHLIEAFLKVLNLWSWILALFGFAAKYLKRENKFLTYSNRAVYPFYILHQTVMMVLAFFLVSQPWNWMPKTLILVIGTFGISWIIYELLIRPSRFIGPLFGMKGRREFKKS